MDTLEKLATLGEEARYDLCCGACGTEAGRRKDDIGRWIYPAVMPDGKKVALLKVLQTNVCENDCYYCATRRSSDVRRTAFTPDELARAFEELALRGRVQGLFLSSGVAGSATRSMDRMLATAELVRRKQGFRGYIHLKILPGSSRAHVEQAMLLADRVSVNLEAPAPERLSRIAPDKDFFGGLIQMMRWVHEIRQSREELSGVSQTTQLVVGAAQESDAEILHAAARLYREFGLSRVYYSAFQPQVGTPLAELPPTPPLREHRLYQCDFLLRQYGFALEDLPFDDGGFLSLSTDPKVAWAMRHPQHFPIEVNCAELSQLLRVPGIGPQAARRVIQARRQGRIRTLRDLKQLGADAERAAPYVLLDGKRPPYQLALWDRA
ncbi:MAG: radical SAM protein [Anaerolineae bacterium]